MRDKPIFICRNCGEPCELRLVKRNYIDDDGYQDIYYVSDCCGDDYIESDDCEDEADNDD